MRERPPRTAPRTLAQPPPHAPLRAPCATQSTARFPALTALVAGASLASGCHDLQCGDARIDELDAHGPEALRAARAGNASDALRQLGVALGLAAHTPTRVQAPGEMPAVTTQPQPPVVPVAPPPRAPEPPRELDGDIAPVSPLPPESPRPTVPRDTPRTEPGRRMGRPMIVGPRHNDPF